MQTGFYRKLEAPLGLAVVDLCDYYGKGLIITRVNVPAPHRGKGIASELLKEVTVAADQDRVNLYLEIAASDGLDNDQLRAWYERHGFVGSAMLMRRPR